MANHPIEGLMDTIMSNFKTMVDVNTVVGTPVTGPDGTLIIPVSTVSYGFGVGGSEFETKNPVKTTQDPLFGGGYGGGASVKPIAFLVVSNGNVKLLPVSPETSPVNKIIDMVPDIVDKVNCVISDVSKKSPKKDKKDDKENNPVDCKVDIIE